MIFLTTTTFKVGKVMKKYYNNFYLNLKRVIIDVDAPVQCSLYLTFEKVTIFALTVILVLLAQKIIVFFFYLK